MQKGLAYNYMHMKTVVLVLDVTTIFWLQNPICCVYVYLKCVYVWFYQRNRKICSRRYGFHHRKIFNSFQIKRQSSRNSAALEQKCSKMNLYVAYISKYINPILFTPPKQFSDFQHPVTRVRVLQSSPQSQELGYQ